MCMCYVNGKDRIVSFVLLYCFLFCFFAFNTADVATPQRSVGLARGPGICENDQPFL